MKTVGSRLKNLREELGMGQEQLANHLNLSRQSVSNFENDRANLSSEQLTVLSEITKVNVNWLLTGIGSMFLGATETYINSAGKNNNGVQQNGKQIGSGGGDDKDKEIAYLKGKIDGLNTLVEKLLTNKEK